MNKLPSDVWRKATTEEMAIAYWKYRQLKQDKDSVISPKTSSTDK